MKKIFFLFLFVGCNYSSNTMQDSSNNYDDLIDLFKEWREFETPPLLNGAPDYTDKRFNNDQKKYKELRNSLDQFKIDDWSISNQIDWHIIRAEMNGYDFNFRVLMPWKRDPAFYQTIWMRQSDVPAHEGPTNHGVLEYWMYDLPLDKNSKNQFLNEINSITPFLQQAKKNLTGNAKDLWIAGIENFKQQKDNIKKNQERFEFRRYR